MALELRTAPFISYIYVYMCIYVCVYIYKMHVYMHIMQNNKTIVFLAFLSIGYFFNTPQNVLCGFLSAKHC